MTAVTLLRGKNGEFKAFGAEGHAGFASKGNDIVCAAVTVLLRTAMQVLSKTEGVAYKADTASRGNLAFSVEVTKSDSDTEERLITAADFIAEGIASLQKEYPEHVILREEIAN